jgi:predicted neutral ceramidase superfamily lipid hydrolase
LSSGLIALKSMAPMFLNQPNAQQQIPADAQRAISDLISSAQVTTTDTHVKFSLVFTQGMLDVMGSAAKARAQAGQ